jgi:hypothetical protein
MIDAARVPRVLLWRHDDRAKPRQEALTADGPAWFSVLTIAGTDHTPLPLTVCVADRPHNFSSVWLHVPDGDIPTQRAIDSCARALNILHLDRKMDFVGAELPDGDDDDIRSLHMDFVPHLTCIDAVAGYRSAFCIRRQPCADGNLVLICALNTVASV